MRLLFVSQDFPPDVGGIQTYSWEISRRLASSVDKCIIVAPRRPGWSEVDKKLDARVRRLRARPDLLPIAALGTLPVIAHKHRVDVSFHAQWQTAGAAILARRLTGYPRRIVSAVHGRELLFNPFNTSTAVNAYEFIKSSILQRVNVFLPVSRFSAELVSPFRSADSTVHVIHNGTDITRFYPTNRTSFRNGLGATDRPMLLFVGRLVERKGVDSALEALKKVRDVLSNVLFIIAGGGSDRPRLEAISRRLGLENNVRFVGPIAYDDLAQAYSASDVLVMPSRSDGPDVEGFGIVFLEANACGIPVIGARSGGIPDAIVHEETGLLVEPDDIDGLAAAMIRLLEDHELRKRMGKNGRERVVREFTWDHVAEQVLGILGSLR